jgi:hypothetical protein
MVWDDHRDLKSNRGMKGDLAWFTVSMIECPTLTALEVT